jgi:hypothetical protein
MHGTSRIDEYLLNLGFTKTAADPILFIMINLIYLSWSYM